jgi:hypothetical protein
MERLIELIEDNDRAAMTAQLMDMQPDGSSETSAVLDALNERFAHLEAENGAGYSWAVLLMAVGRALDEALGPRTVLASPEPQG